MDVLLYSEQVDPLFSMHSSLVLTLMPILKDLYQREYSFTPKLFITSNAILYLERNYPEENMLIKSLVKEGKLEILLSSFSNINPLLFPPRSISEDIEKMSTLIRKTYAKRPSGYFTYKNVITMSLISALYDLGIEDMYTSRLYNIDIDREKFYYSDGFKAVTIHTPLKNSSDFFALDLDKNDSDNYVEDILRLFREIDGKTDKSLLNFEKFPYVKSYYYKDSRFIPSGCYDGKNSVNFVSELYKNENEYFASLMYIRHILLNPENRKSALKGKKHLEAKMYALSDLGLYLQDEITDEYKREKMNIFSSLLEELSILSLLTSKFETPKEVYEALFSKNIFALVDNTTSIKKLIYLPKRCDFLENGYAFKTTFSEGDKKDVNIDFFMDENAKNTSLDRAYRAFEKGVETSKEVHVRNASITVKFVVKNVEQKIFTSDFENSFSFSSITVDSKNTSGDIKTLRLKFQNADGSLLLSSSKPFFLKNGINFDENQKTLLIKPSFNIKLKKGETFDVSFTLKYEKAQGE